MTDETQATPQNEQPELPPELAALDPEKLAKIRENIEKFKASREQTVSGSEAPSDVPMIEPASEGQRSPITGKDVDWSEYNLPYDVAHLYPRSFLRQTEQGVKWVALVTEYVTVQRAFEQRGKQLKDGSPMNLGEYMTDMVNSRDQWRVVGMLPAGIGQGAVILAREVPIVLPDPEPLKKNTEVEPPRDEELNRVEKGALDWAQAEGCPTPELEEESANG